MLIITITLILHLIYFHKTNFLMIAILLDIFYLIISYYFITYNIIYFSLIIIGITGAETALGLSLILNYYLKIS